MQKVEVQTRMSSRSARHDPDRRDAPPQSVGAIQEREKRDKVGTYGVFGLAPPPECKRRIRTSKRSNPCWNGAFEASLVDARLLLAEEGGAEKGRREREL